MRAQQSFRANPSAFALVLHRDERSEKLLQLYTAYGYMYGSSPTNSPTNWSVFTLGCVPQFTLAEARRRRGEAGRRGTLA